MAKRPTRYPRFATAAAPGALVEPTGGYIQSGLPIDRTLPAQWYNYQHNLIGGWVDFLRGPSLANWTERSVNTEIYKSIGARVHAAFIAADVDSPDDAARSRIVVAGIDSDGDLRVYASHRGIHWYEVTGFEDIGAPGVDVIRGIRCDGGLWHLWTGAKFLYTVVDDGANSALTAGASVPWDIIEGIGLVSSVAYDSTHGNRWVATTTTGAWRSTNGIDWEQMTASSVGNNVTWDGARFVSVSISGPVWTTPDPDTPFTLAATIPPATLEGTLFGHYRIASGEGKLFIYQLYRSDLEQQAYLSLDHGANWVPVALPSGMRGIYDIVCIEGQWLATTMYFPYFWESSDLHQWDRSFLPLPQDLSGFELVGAAAARDSVLLLGREGHTVWQSTIAHDAANGDPTTFTTPVARSDAAYLQGREIAETAPINGQAPCWNAVTQRYEPADVGAVIGDPNVFDVTWPLAQGFHDFMADANFASAAFPDSEVGEKSSAVLGDGIDVPYFYAIHPANVGGLQRTVDGRMRLKLGALGNSTWPGNVDAPAIAYPLPRSQRLEFEFTLYLSAAALNNGNVAGFTISRNGNVSGSLEVICRVEIQATGASSANETVSLWNNNYAANGVNGYIVGSTFSRHYRVVIDGPNLAVYGGAVGSSVANTLIRGRSNVARGLSRNDMCLAFSVASSGVVSAPLYLEHGPLHWEGIKS